MKHLTLVLCLDHLKKKEAPFFVLDAHGGCGLYDLTSIQAQKTREWEAGIGRMIQSPDANPDLVLYLAQIKSDWARQHYPGSPLLTARMLRENDRLIANELHPEDVETLKDNLWNFPNVRVTAQDAYESIRAYIPPAERRGLVLIDPPFEDRREFETLCRQMKEWKKRWATGLFLLWYPIKAHLAVVEMKRAAADLGLPRTWCWETLLHPAHQPETFNGCGLVMFNAPYQIPERLEALMPLLKNSLKLHKNQTEWLTPA